ncbi:hypothetical protein E2C01_077568 [Portunus trituberculatus]|uniref:Uncharacterized protein n=1 Tax=Portunus trituberculatus TaxID=210409 RepID=A0A5B7IGD2_PORTR|nr:hypothetical protein [Portunus trituberculatus]
MHTTTPPNLHTDTYHTSLVHNHILNPTPSHLNHHTFTITLSHQTSYHLIAVSHHHITRPHHHGTIRSTYYHVTTPPLCHDTTPPQHHITYYSFIAPVEK